MTTRPVSRRRFITGALAFALVVSSWARVPAHEETDPQTVSGPADTRAFSADIHWDQGLRYELRQPVSVGGPDRPIPYRLLDGDVTLKGKIGGKLAVDGAAFVTQGGLGPIDDGIQLRRARVYTTGDFYLLVPMFYKAEVSVVNQEFLLEEVYVGFPKLPVVQNVTVGNITTPVGLEAVVSGRDTTFMETAAAVQAFAPGIKPGVLLGGPVLGQRATWALGWFGPGGRAEFGGLSGLTTGVGRLTWLPVDSGEGESRTLLHLGVSASLSLGHDETIRYKSRPESHIAPVLVDTKEIRANSTVVVNLESAFVTGPFSLQAEYFRAVVDRAAGSALDLSGLYVFGSWFLTGESRPYDTSTGRFTRVRPRRDMWPWGRGPGAVEVAARYSHLDLDDGAVRGGIMDIGMLGVNWYWSPFVKTRFNYGVAGISGHDPGGRVFIFQGRFELDF
jgi:phosphate-selective porin OprO and OprP